MNLSVQRRPAPRRVTAAALAVACVVATVTVGAVGPAAAATGVPLIGVASGLCLDVSGNRQTAGTPVQLFTCHGQANQRWSLPASGDLRVFDDARCLEAEGGAATPGTRAVIALCTGVAGQQWRLTVAGTVVHQTSGMCLDVFRAGLTAGTPVILWTCHGGANQRWRFAVSDTTPPTPPGAPRSSNVACRSLTLTWTASTDNVGIAAYDVFHDGQLVTSVSGSTLSTSVPAVPGVTYGWYVNARDAAGNVSQASPTLLVTPPQCVVDTVPPSTPTGVSAAATGTSVTVRWTASTDNVGVTTYDVLRDGVQAGRVAGTSTVPPGTTFTDSGLAANHTYVYTVTARDAQANVSPASAPVSVTTGSACSSAICSITQVATETDIPWGLVTLPDGTLLYSRRDAHDIIRLDPVTGTKTNLGTVPNVQSTDGEGGLLGLAVASTFASDGWLYAMHTSPTDNRIVRIHYANGALSMSSEQVLLTGILRNKFHNGGRLRFGPDGMLYASTGDAQNGANAQALTGPGALNGKVLRLTPTGGVPAGNPFNNYVWSYGHRNPQGLAFDGQGRLWEQEFGNSTMDETNLIVRGGNHGWPQCEGTLSVSGTGCAGPGLVAPKQTYPTSAGSCSGIAIVANVLYVACERGTRLYREVISGSSLTSVTQLLVGTYGRLRTVEPAADGGLWLTTTNLGDKDSIPNNSNEKILHLTLGG